MHRAYHCPNVQVNKTSALGHVALAPGLCGERETGLRAPALRIHLEQVDGSDEAAIVLPKSRQAHRFAGRDAAIVALDLSS